MTNVIFDLDGTVIDTSHRYRNKPCGTIDLDFWFANSTPEMIAQDRLLPLANSMRRLYKAGHTIIVCTARDFSPNPRVPIKDIGAVYEKFLADNDLRYHALLHRTMAGPDHLQLSDGDLKIRLLNNYARSIGLDNMADLKAIMFDDNLGVLEAMRKNRVYPIDATKENARLAG